MCMRASEASELRKFWYFYILKLLFLSIFCRYIRYFVGTNDMLVGLHVPTNFPMYRQISKCTDKSPKRHYWGGGGGNCPPPPCGYANGVWVISHLHSKWSIYMDHLRPTLCYNINSNTTGASAVSHRAVTDGIKRSTGQ